METEPCGIKIFLMGLISNTSYIKNMNIQVKLKQMYIICKFRMWNMSCNQGVKGLSQRVWVVARSHMGLNLGLFGWSLDRSLQGQEGVSVRVCQAAIRLFRVMMRVYICVIYLQTHHYVRFC